jgi:hypothetical protein
VTVRRPATPSHDIVTLTCQCQWPWNGYGHCRCKLKLTRKNTRKVVLNVTYTVNRLCHDGVRRGEGGAGGGGLWGWEFKMKALLLELT